MKRGSKANRLSDRYVGVPVIFLMSLLKRRRTELPEVRRIAIMTSPTLGDTLLSSAVLLDVRRQYPDAHITCIASPTNVAAARLLPAADEVLNVSLTQPLMTIRALRQGAFDLFLDFTAWQRLTAFYTAMSGAKYTVGFRSCKQYRHWNYDTAADHLRTQHEVDNFRSLLMSIGIQPSAQPALRVRKAHRDASASSTELIVFHPWASGDLSSLREWPTDRWVALAALLNSSDVLFTITGGPGDKARCNELRCALFAAGIQAEIACGSPALDGLVALLQSASLVVSVNTGIMHLAAIAGAPTVSINGPTNKHRWGPIGPRAVSVEPPSGGGFLHFGFEFAGNPIDSMLSTGVQEVFDAALRVSPSLRLKPRPANLSSAL